MKQTTQPSFGDELQPLPFRARENKVYVDYHAAAVQAGFPSPADDFKETPISLDAKYLDNPESTFLVRVAGDSMAPTLQRDDVLIVKAGENVKEGSIVIASVNASDFAVKRFYNGQLRSDNAKYPPVKIGADDTLLLLGVVKHVIRDV